MKPRIGILGAGKVGVVLAQLFLKADYIVYIAGSGDASKIAMTAKILTPGAIPETKEAVSRVADVIILALPLSKYRSIPKDLLKGKLVIDAMNHWYEVDGPREDSVPVGVSSSEWIQQYLPKSKVVKALSHMGYHELYDGPREHGDPGRKAIAVAGKLDDSAVVMVLINAIGFDPLYIGVLNRGSILEPGQKGFAANLDKHVLTNLLG